MPEDERAKARDRRDRERFAIEREERELAAREEELRRRAEELGEDIEAAEHRIDHDRDVVNRGGRPESVPYWDDPDDPRGRRGSES